MKEQKYIKLKYQKKCFKEAVSFNFFRYTPGKDLQPVSTTWDSGRVRQLVASVGRKSLLLRISNGVKLMF